MCARRAHPLSSRLPHGRGPVKESKPARPTRSEAALLACLFPCPPSTHCNSHFSSSLSLNIYSLWSPTPWDSCFLRMYLLYHNDMSVDGIFSKESLFVVCERDKGARGQSMEPREALELSFTEIPAPAIAPRNRQIRHYNK
jgi:hypothetical protein